MKNMLNNYYWSKQNQFFTTLKTPKHLFLTWPYALLLPIGKNPKNNKPYTSEFLTVMAADCNYISCCHSSVIPVLKDILL